MKIRMNRCRLIIVMMLELQTMIYTSKEKCKERKLMTMLYWFMEGDKEKKTEEDRLAELDKLCRDFDIVLNEEEE